MNDKPFLTPDKQMDLLKSRGLNFKNERIAKEHLLQYGYYEIINGYEDWFLNKSSPQESFKSGTTFEHIFDLFLLDRDISTQVMAALENVELNLRQAVAYAVSSRISEKQSIYLNRKHYRTGKKQYYRSLGTRAYPVDVLIGILKRATYSQQQPFKHYREDHHNIPPWIIVKKLNFGNLIWWYRLLKSPEKKLVISIMLPKEISELDNDSIAGFSDFLLLCLNYRNAAAHGERIYNHRSKRYKLKYRKSIQPLIGISEADYRKGKGQSKLGTLCKTLKLLRNKLPYAQLKIGLCLSLEKHFKAYPQDEKFILQQIELKESDLLHLTQN